MSQTISETQTLLEQAIARNPLQVPPDMLVTDAIAAMNQASSSYALVVHRQEIQGIFTERDVVKIAANQTPIEGVIISQVMTQNLITLPLAQAGDIFSVLALLRSSGIRHLPIMDDQGQFLGIVSSESLRAVLKPTDLLQMRRVEEIMNHQVITAPTTASVLQVANLMATHRKSCVVICPASQDCGAISDHKPLKPIGIITERDIVKFKAQKLDLTQTPAAAVMSSPLVPVKPQANLWQANQLMQELGIRRLVVVDEAGYLAGIVTQSTLLHILDPMEMYANFHLLEQTIAEKTEQLKQKNQQLQQTEEQLRQTNENLETQVRERTQELIEANTQLKQEIVERIAAEAEVRRLNTELEQRVQERTVQLEASNRNLQQALDDLKTTQEELIHSAKMAVLGQLIASVAHEINTPLGAIRSSVRNIADFFTQRVEHLPSFFQELLPELQQDFLAILEKSTCHTQPLSSREKRQLKKALQKQLQEHGVAEAESIADLLTTIEIFDDIEQFLPLFKAPEKQIILKTAYDFAIVRKSAQIITTAAERAAKVVFALKYYARHETSDTKTFANIVESIETVLILYQHQGKNHVEVNKNYSDSLPLLLCYTDQINQVWTNLIHNALQALNKPGTLEISVTHNSEQIIVSITDSGPGIPPEIIPRIFEPFFTTKPPGEGSGLGLNIVKKIVEKHDGTIEVESVPGETTFTVKLPINLTNT